MASLLSATPSEAQREAAYPFAVYSAQAYLDLGSNPTKHISRADFPSVFADADKVPEAEYLYGWRDSEFGLGRRAINSGLEAGFEAHVLRPRMSRRWIIAYRGSESGGVHKPWLPFGSWQNTDFDRDWLQTDIRQFLGDTVTQYNLALKFALRVDARAKLVGDSGVSDLTGHSLGGGLATAAAAGLPAARVWTFNAAQLNAYYAALVRKEGRLAPVRHYRVESDPVSRLGAGQEGVGQVIELPYVPPDNRWLGTLLLLNPVLRMGDAHRLPTVMRGLLESPGARCRWNRLLDNFRTGASRWLAVITAAALGLAFGMKRLRAFLVTHWKWPVFCTLACLFFFVEGTRLIGLWYGSLILTTWLIDKLARQTRSIAVVVLVAGALLTGSAIVWANSVTSTLCEIGV